MSEADQHYYQSCLKNKLMERIDRNPRYSIRSFASALGMNSSALSQILSGKRSISTKVIERILNYLELSPSEQKLFLESVIREKKERGLERVSPELTAKLSRISENFEVGPLKTVGLDEFRVIADWYHYAILELTFAENFKSEPKWIAKTLGLSVTETVLAVDRLVQLELLERIDGTLKKTNFNLDTRDKSKSSAFLRKRQKQVLEKSIESLEKDPIEIRSHSSLTICIDPKQIPIVKVKIQKLMWDIAQSLVSGTPKEVYELSVNLFPLQIRTGPNACSK